MENDFLHNLGQIMNYPKLKRFPNTSTPPPHPKMIKQNKKWNPQTQKVKSPTSLAGGWNSKSEVRKAFRNFNKFVSKETRGVNKMELIKVTCLIRKVIILILV